MVISLLIVFEENTILLCFFLKDTDIIITPGSRGRTTRNMKFWWQNDLVINLPQWNLNEVFTEEEALQVRTKGSLYQVSLVKYQVSGNSVEMQLDKDLDSDSSNLNVFENSSEQGEDK